MYARAWGRLSSSLLLVYVMVWLSLLICVGEYPLHAIFCIVSDYTLRRSVFMKENFEKFKYLIAGSVLTSEKSGYKSYKFDVPKVMSIVFTIYDNGEDFIYIHGDYFCCSYWFGEVEIRDFEDGCYISLFDIVGEKRIFIGSFKLKNIYLEVRE